MVNSKFWRGKRVFLTGHTGFKGGWLSLWLAHMGAKVTGYSLKPNTTPNLFQVANVEDILVASHIADVRDLERLTGAINIASPEIVFHMAAQPLVRHSYVNPVETYATNVMGTVHLLECMRSQPNVRATVIVTSDKCYENKEWVWGYRENEAMGGFDPYSSSKGCAELVTAAYRQSYFDSGKNSEHLNGIATARAGNVIGGGDWSIDRLIPDAIRSFDSNEKLILRNPFAIRPWQHVLEPLSGYLVLAESLYTNNLDFTGGWNFGPADRDARPVHEVIDLLLKGWGNKVNWTQDGANQPHEAHLLKLDCSKARQFLNWLPTWNIETAVEKIIDWHQAFQEKLNMRAVCIDQIVSYESSLLKVSEK